MGGGKFPYHTHCGNVVKAFLIGNSRIRICDDFCRDVSKAEAETQLDEISRQIMQELEWDDETQMFIKAIPDSK